jgi:hypothetical protein
MNERYENEIAAWGIPNKYGIHECRKCGGRLSDMPKKCECPNRPKSDLELFRERQCKNHDVSAIDIETGACPNCPADSVESECFRKFVAAYTSPELTHTRARQWCGGSWAIYAYHRDRTSPTGVKLACSISEDVFKVIEQLHDRRRQGMSPLSPTEGLGGNF